MVLPTIHIATAACGSLSHRCHRALGPRGKTLPRSDRLPAGERGRSPGRKREPQGTGSGITRLHADMLRRLQRNSFGYFTHEINRENGLVLDKTTMTEGLGHVS